jgi:hypothetical protein
MIKPESVMVTNELLAYFFPIGVMKLPIAFVQVLL